MQTATAQSVERALTREFRIGALQGAKTAEIQKILVNFVERRLREGLRVAGMIEEPAQDDGGGACGSLVLRDVASSSLIPITQDLGSGSTACRLDSGGLAAACQAVLTAIDHGADLVVLSKFGKMEAEGGGLIDAFRAAAEAGVPCVTGVAPSVTGPFLDYAGGFSQWIEASDAALEHWWAGTPDRLGAL